MPPEAKRPYEEEAAGMQGLSLGSGVRATPSSIGPPIMGGIGQQRQHHSQQQQGKSHHLSSGPPLAVPAQWAQQQQQQQQQQWQSQPGTTDGSVQGSEMVSHCERRPKIGRIGARKRCGAV
jgi:hypothetical protein